MTLLQVSHRKICAFYLSMIPNKLGSLGRTAVFVGGTPISRSFAALCSVHGRSDIGVLCSLWQSIDIVGISFHVKIVGVLPTSVLRNRATLSLYLVFGQNRAMEFSSHYLNLRCTCRNRLLNLRDLRFITRRWYSSISTMLIIALFNRLLLLMHMPSYISLDKSEK
jgi:hypothetical protein